MHKILFVLMLLLAGCVKQSGSYYVSEKRDHAITVRAEQEYVWDQNISLSLVVSHFPDCQRAMPLTKVPKSDVVVELFSSGDGVYTIRSGDELKQFETENCTELPTPAPNAIGSAVGVFRLVEGQSEKLDFENTAAASATAPAPEAEPVAQ